MSEEANRYAKALFHLNPSRKEELHTLLSIFNRSPDTMRFFTSRHVAQQEKHRVLKKTLEGKVDKELLSFFLFLFKMRRFYLLPEIVQAYTKMEMEKGSEIKGRLILAQEVPPKIIERLQAQIEKLYHKKTQFEVEIDPQLIGGGVMIFGGKLIDFSVKAKLARLKKDLLK